jgi:uncharacterized membrane protein YqhA
MRKFFNAVFSLHYVAILAVIAPFFGAVLMLLFGAQNTIEAYLLFFGFEEPEGAIEAGEMAMIKLVASIDHFLFAAILMIFAIGLYNLFFRGGSMGNRRKTPSWNHLKEMGGMDEMLLKVIIMLLAVSFLEHTLTEGFGTLKWTDLVIPGAIIGLALALKWMSAATADDVLEQDVAGSAANSIDNAADQES